jgi:hypothetical protein
LRFNWERYGSCLNKLGSCIFLQRDFRTMVWERTYRSVIF